MYMHNTFHLCLQLVSLVSLLIATKLSDLLVEVNEINAYSVPLCTKRAEINSISLTERCFVAAIYVYYMYLQIPYIGKISLLK